MRIIRCFEFDICLLKDETEPPPRELPWKLLNLLSRLPRLEKLTFIIPGPHINDFADSIARAELVLPNVQSLVVGPSCSIVTPLCPNLTTLAQPYPLGHFIVHRTIDEFKFFETQSILRNITTLELHQDWNPDLLRVALRIFPSVRSLSEIRPSRPTHSIRNLVPILAQFEYLESLALAGPLYLGREFRPLTYFMTKQESKQIEERVAAIVIPSCSKLRELWVGERSRAEIVQGAIPNEVQFGIIWHHSKVRKEVAPTKPWDDLMTRT